jgi:hypothetical protein
MEDSPLGDKVVKVVAETHVNRQLRGRLPDDLFELFERRFPFFVGMRTRSNFYLKQRHLIC